MVVVTLRVAETVDEPFSVMPELGAHEQSVSLGNALLQLSNTTPLKPLIPVTVTE